MRRLLILAALLTSAPTWAANYATCILDKMPGTQNGAAHAAVIQTCIQEHPAGYSGVAKGSGRGLFGFKNGNACTIDKAKQTSFQPAATMIAVACRCLYDEPYIEGASCSSDFDPSTARPAN